MLSNSASILVLILCLTSAVKAVEEQEKQQQDQEPQEQQPFQMPAMDLTPEQTALAREGIRQILSQVPAQTVEPLFETIDGYCKAFEAICSLSCEERGAGEGAQATEKTGSHSVGGCINQSAMSVATAQATCVCAGYDLTDRVNFAILGGVVSSKAKPTSDFTAEGFLDGLTFIPGVPVFLNIIHGVQSACHFLDTWVDSPSQSTPAPPNKPGATTGSGGSGLLSGGLSGILPFLGGLLGGTHADKPTTPGPAAVDIPATDPSAVSNILSTPIAVTEPVPVPAKGGFFSWFPHLWAETDDQGHFDGEDSQQEGGASRIISRDGRIARITRVQQQRQTEMDKKKRVWDQAQKHDL